MIPSEASGTSLPQLPALVNGVVRHTRHTGWPYSFRHRIYLWLVDLDEIPRWGWPWKLLAGFDPTDHFGEPTRSPKDNVIGLLRADGVEIGATGRIIMLASARTLGYVFNPLSVYWCFDSGGELVRVLAEVHNTYQERHVYVLAPDAEGRAETSKNLYVSPFCDPTGRYQLRFRLDGHAVTVGVSLVVGGEQVLTTAFHGLPVPATRSVLGRHFVGNPVVPIRTAVLIRIHGMGLMRRLPRYPRR
ncbi:DUF1365 domain-containing protein [Nocardia sp. CA-145437]|uniref:DUF1365 domain-containing protein n=1 Tax=Nocardia sp. CA-145437 TaxID=3239980 RepID=UPI003D952FA9